MTTTSRVPYANNASLLVVNLLGGPGVGKSTIAHAVVNDLKRSAINAEYVGEFAKDLTWSRDAFLLGEQDYVFAMQNNRLRRLVGQVDVVVMDTSLLLGLLYMPQDFPSSFKQFVVDAYNSYNNLNVVIDRVPHMKYEQTGRNQSAAEAVKIDDHVIDLLTTHNQPYSSFFANDEQVTSNITRLIKPRIQRHPTTDPLDVDVLSNFIRKVDGQHNLGAGALAEKIVEFVKANK